jgi:O-antigen/teichoic acid export membrane protein
LGDVPTGLLTVVAIALPVQMLTYMSLGIYLGLERIGKYNLIDLSLQGIILANAIVTLILLGLGIREFVLVGAVANMIAGVVVLCMLARDTRSVGGVFRRNGKLMREMIGYGIRFFVAMAAGLVILRGDLLIVNYISGASEAGVYAVATQVATFLHMMPNVISTLLFPRTSAAQDESGQLTCRVTRHAVFIMVVLCIAAIPCAYLLPLLYGPAFSAVPVLFLILLPGVFMLGIETIQVQHFTGLGLPRVISAVWVMLMIFNIALNVVLVPRFGAYGAAVSSSVSYAIVFAFIAVYFRANTGRTFGEAFILRREELRDVVNAAFMSTRIREGRV